MYACLYNIIYIYIHDKKTRKHNKNNRVIQVITYNRPCYVHTHTRTFPRDHIEIFISVRGTFILYYNVIRTHMYILYNAGALLIFSDLGHNIFIYHILLISVIEMNKT